MVSRPSRGIHLSAGARRDRNGFSLVEMMVAMTLGLIVIAALGQLYVGGRNTQHIVQANAALTERARFALEFFARNIRMAGYFTCGGERASLGNALNSGSYWPELKGLDGIEGGDGSQPVSDLPAPFSLFPTPSPGSDIIIVRYADTKHLLSIGDDDLDAASAQFIFDKPHDFAVGDVAIANDAGCLQTSVFQVTDLPASAPSVTILYDASHGDLEPGNCTNDLAGNFTCADLSRRRSLTGDEFDGGNITKLIARAFFIAPLPASQCKPDPGVCAALKPCPALYIAGTETAGAVPVMPDVTAMQIDYGIDSDLFPGVDRYDNASNLVSDQDWAKVMSVRITLTMIRSDCRPVTFTSTVALRNQAVLSSSH